MDFDILFWIQSWRTPLLDSLFLVITHLGDEGAIWILIGLSLWYVKRTRMTGIAIGTALIMEVLCVNAVLKEAVDRVRPCAIETIQMAMGCPDSPSWPSGHTGASFAAATVLLLMHRRWGWPALVLAALIAFSRMYLFVHYPTDVAAGVVIGCACGVLGVKLAPTVIKIVSDFAKKNHTK
jgi:undecaprenyl-diphosphatase